MSLPERTLDIVVHGATGYTGRLISRYLASATSASTIRWAVAGRSKDKLEVLAADCAKLVAERKSGQKPLVIVADSGDAAALRAMCVQTKVVIACAGPFSKYGMPLVEACVDTQTHYVDITGEFPFIREMIERVHEKAVAKGVLLLPCSGFDAIPSDIGNAYAFRLADEAGTQIRHVEAAFRCKFTGASRGTLESVLNIRQAIGKADLSPLSLVAKPNRRGIATPRVVFPWYHSTFGQYIGPFMMAATNEKVVRRSNSLAGPHRAQSSYVEMIRGGLLEVAVQFVAFVAMAVLFVPGVATVLRKYVFPAAGEGPKDTNGSFTVDVLGYASRDAKKPVVHGRISCDLECYGFTAISAAETALAVLNEETDSGVVGGVVTPGAALTQALPRRLEASGRVKFVNLRR